RSGRIAATIARVEAEIFLQSQTFRHETDVDGLKFQTGRRIKMSVQHPKFILMLEDVNKAFEGFKAISDLTFYMDEGELRTVIGPNGAGKSSMLDLITGRTKPDKGKIEFGFNTDLTQLNEAEITRLGIGRKFQTPSVYIEHTVFENIWLSLEGSRSVWTTLFSRVTQERRDRIYEVLK